MADYLLDSIRNLIKFDNIEAKLTILTEIKVFQIGKF